MISLKLFDKKYIGSLYKKDMFYYQEKNVRKVFFFIKVIIHLIYFNTFINYYQKLSFILSMCDKRIYLW